MADLSSYGLTASTDGGGSLSFDASGAIANLTPKFVSALEDASAKVSAAAASAIAGLDAAAEVAGYISTDVAAALTTASAEATALGASALTGPLAPIVAALVVAVAFVEGNLASGGTGCCGVGPYSREQAIQVLSFPHQPILGTTSGSSFYVPPEADVRNLMLYSGQGANAGPCDPSQYKWNALFPGIYLPRAAGSPEAYIEGVLRAHYENSAGCWTDWDKLNAQTPAVLAAAVKAWNATHYTGPSARTVLVTPIDPWQNPINFAVAQLRKTAKQPEAFISFKVNTGAQIHPAIVAVPKLARSGVNLSKSLIASLSPPKGKTMGITDAALSVGGVPASMAALTAIQSASPADTALIAVSAPPPAATSTSLFSKPLVGKVTYGEAGIGAAALAVITKLMKVW